jgi:hypothetical protein
MFGSLSRRGRNLVSFDLCPIEMTKAVQRMLMDLVSRLMGCFAADEFVAHCWRLTIPPQSTIPKKKLSGLWAPQTSRVRSNKNELNKEKRS